MIKNGLIVSFIKLATPQITLLHDDTTVYKITDLPDINRSEFSYWISQTGLSNFSYIKSYLIGTVIYVNAVNGRNNLIDYIYHLKRDVGGNVVNTDVLDLYGKVENNLLNTNFYKGKKDVQYYLYQDFTGLYDITSGTMTVSEGYVNNKNSLVFTINGLDYNNFYQLTQFKLSCVVTINGVTIQNLSNNTYTDTTDRNNLKHYVYLSEDVIKKINYVDGGTLSVSAQLRVHFIDGFLNYYSYNSNYTPIVIPNNINVSFNVTSSYFNLKEQLQALIPNHDSAIKGSYSIIDSKDKRVVGPIRYTTDTSYNFTSNFDLGTPYKIKTSLYTPFYSKTLVSDSVNFYHSESYLNIYDVALKVTGTKYDTNPIEFDYYTATGSELSSNNKLSTKFYSVTGVVFNFTFKLKNNSVTMKSGTDNKIVKQLAPTTSTIVLFRKNSDFEKHIPTARVNSTLRPTDTKDLFPNITTGNAKKLLDNIKTYPTGIIVKETTYNRIANPWITDGESYTIDVNVPDSGNYGAILILTTGTSTYGYNYTAYNLSNLNSNTTQSQFDF